MTDKMRVIQYSGGGGWLDIINLQQPDEVWLNRHHHERVSSLAGITVGPGVTFVKAPQGTGKTQLVGKPLVQAADSAVAISPRISLATTQAGMLGITSYHDKVTKTRKVAICVNSINSANWDYVCRTAKVVFIDEILQVLRQVALGPVQDRARLFEALRSLIRNAQTLLVADADVNAEVVAFLEECRPGERFRVITMEADLSHLKVEWSARPGAVEAVFWDIEQAMGLGEKVIVATDSKAKALRLKAHLKGAKVLLVTADTKGSPAQQAFMRDPNVECLKYDAIIHSPAMSSGVSIEVEHFTRALGLFSGVIVPTDAVQMLRRVRTITSWKVAFDWRQQTKLCGLASAEAILYAASVSSGGQVPTRYDRFRATWTAWEELARFKFAAGMIRYLREAGFQTEEFDPEEHDVELPDVDEDRIAEIVAARRLTQAEYEVMRRRSDLDSREVAEVRRAAIARFLRTEELTPDMVRFVEFENGWKILPRYELAAGFVEPANAHCHVTDRRNDQLRKDIWGDLTKILGVDLRTGHGRFTRDQAAQVAAYCRKHPEILVYLKIAPRSALRRISDERAVEFVRGVLGKIGIRMAMRQGGSGARFYEIRLPDVLVETMRIRWSQPPTLDTPVYIGDGGFSVGSQIGSKAAENKGFQGVSQPQAFEVGTPLDSGDKSPTLPRRSDQMRRAQEMKAAGFVRKRFSLPDGGREWRYVPAA